MKVSKSGYYQWLHRIPSKRSILNALLLKEIYRIYNSSKSRYGSPRITRDHQKDGKGVVKGASKLNSKSNEDQQAISDKGATIVNEPRKTK
ncbi:MAG: hypothetical protein SGJ15_14550 [Bacteroidota bacterium]|nr:hypothetical protein [Bacteroidota bacterium]